MKNLSWIARIIIFVLFILSAAAKTWPHIWPFEKQLVDLGISSWCIAPYLARAIIGLEFAIGFAILFPFALKRVIIPITILLLIAFCIHLGIQMYEFGPNNGNCGCFGQLIPMTPLEAFIKNILTIGLLVFVYKKLNEKTENKWKIIYPLAIFLASELFMFAAFPFAPCKDKKATASVANITDNPSLLDSIPVDALGTNPIILDTNIAGEVTTEVKANTNTTKPTIESANKPANALKANEVKSATTAASIATNGKAVTVTNNMAAKANAIEDKGPAPVVSKFAAYSNFNGTKIAVDQGKKIICMFAPGCDHCQATAKEICRMGKLPQTVIIFMDEETEKIPDFFKFAGCTFPYQVVDIPTFWTLLGDGSTPGVICLHNGNILKMWEGIDKNKFEASKLKPVFGLQ